MYLVDLPTIVTYARDFETAELKANHAQAVNLVMNGSSDLDSKLKQFIIKKMPIVSKISHVFQYLPISGGSKKRVSATTVISNSESLYQSRAILIHLLINDTATTILTTSVLSSNLSTTATSNLSAAATNTILIANLNNLLTSTNSNTTTKLISKQNPKIKNNTTKLEIDNGSTSTDFQFIKSTIRIMSAEFKNQNYLSLLVTPENTASNEQETNQKPLTSNILPAASTENKLLAAIFPFELEEITSVPLFSGAILDTKPITIMYTDAKVDAANAKIITANRATKIPIDEINNFLFEVNGIIVLIKVLVMEATQYQALIELQLSQNGQHTCVPATCDHFKIINMPALLIEFEKKEKKPTWEDNNMKRKQREKEKQKKKNYYQPLFTFLITTQYHYQLTIAHAVAMTRNTMWQPSFIVIYNKSCLACGKTLLDKGIWNNISGQGGTCDELCQYTILISDWVRKKTPIEAVWRRAVRCLDGCLHNDDEIWQRVIAKIKRTLPEEIREIKNNPPEPEIHEHYQTLAPIKEEQEEHLVQLNTQLCNHCLIPYDFQYCDKCNFIYNLPPRMIYTISEEIKPISSCALKSESIFNSNSNSDNNDNKNTMLPDFTKEQELKWFSNNNEDIMPERVHNTDAGFDLRYPGKKAIKLEPYSHIYIDLKIAIKILATTMIQLAFRSNLVKKGIHIRGRIIDAGYIENIIAMLQNDSEKAYVIEPNKKIVQAIFLPLVKIAQLVLVGNRKKLGITAKGIQGFGSTDRVEISVNMIEEEIIDKKEIISTSQPISIPPYNQYMVVIERKVKNQNQIFEAEAAHCKLGEIGLIYLYIPARNYSCIKIPIYNNTRKVIEIPERTIIRHLTTEIEDQPPNPVPNFLQLCGYVDITLQTIYG
ncbi:hypothetical protein G9A89_023055 [Geosiphon pyriformis]|nr:hypothetical protein G9A89_023055 [Geosiphon pyriformis]